MRRLLWQQYGIAFDDFELADVLHALALAGAEAKRQGNLTKRHALQS